MKLLPKKQIKKEIKKKLPKGKKMEIPRKEIIVAEPRLEITDKKSNKHFGLLLSTQKSIEAFQEKSGMHHAFTTEYQFHYWALVARIKLDDEVLDIAIPTVMYNYKQEVSGAAVSFHLNDVEAASNATTDMASVYCNVLIESSFGKYITESFPNVQWMSVPMNTCHVHPGALSTFSGTDYAKTPSDPGICFPLAEPLEQSSFSSIICHKGSEPFVVRTEYRNATKNKNSIDYKHGTCMSFFKGYSVPLKPIQSLFNNKTSIDVQSYITKDGTVEYDNNQLLQTIVSKFVEIDYEPNTDNINKENIVKPEPKVYGHYYEQGHYGLNSRFVGKQKSFWEREKEDELEKIALPSYNVMRESLIKGGYGITVVSTWSLTKIEEMYIKMNKELQEDIEETLKSKSKVYDLSIDAMIKELLEMGCKKEDIIGKSVAEIETIYEEYDNALEDFLDKKEEANDYSEFILEIADILEPFGFTKAKIKSMTNDEIIETIASIEEPA